MKTKYILSIYIILTSACYDFSLDKRDGSAGYQDANEGDAQVTAESGTSGGTGGSAGNPTYDGRTGGVSGSAGSSVNAGAGGNTTECKAGIACSSAECQYGQTSCDSGASACIKTKNADDGTSCSNGGVCDNGACVACAAGTDCGDADSCQKKSIVCASGAPVCTPVGNAVDGTPCGSNLYCNQGACKPCEAGANCAPASKPCNKGIVSCVQGQIACTDQETLAEDGTPCGDSQVCHSGACVSCTVNLSCIPANPCHRGLTSCATGQSTCVDEGLISDDSPCDDANACTQTDSCQSGECTGSNPITCAASEVCHVAGTCSPATGQCSKPAGNEGVSCGTNKSCQNGNCACITGTSSCSGACVNLTNDKNNCGMCGRGCGAGTCSSSKCQPWVVKTLAGDCAGLASEGTNVVWLDVDSQSVLQMPASGGTGTPLVLSATTTIGNNSTATGPRIAIANGLVAWGPTTSSSSTQTVNVWSAIEGNANSGTKGPQLSSSSIGVLGMGISPSGGATYVLIFDIGTGTFSVQNCVFGWNSCTKLTDVSAASLGGQGVAATATYVFWTYATESVARYSFASSATTNLVSGQGNPGWIAIDSSYVYWVNRISSNSFAINRALQSGTSPPAQSVVATTSGTANAIATDGKYLYFGGLAGTTNVGYVPVSGGTVQTLSTGGSVNRDTLATAGGYVFWYDSTDKTIRAIAAPP